MLNKFEKQTFPKVSFPRMWKFKNKVCTNQDVQFRIVIL